MLCDNIGPIEAFYPLSTKDQGRRLVGHIEAVTQAHLIDPI
jgi:hypothetical protein